MNIRQIKESICTICTLDWGRKLFDEIISLPEGGDRKKI